MSASRQLRVNLDRGRVLLHDLPDEFVVVNIAAYSIYLVRGQEIVWNARAQVGKTYRRTPMFRSDIDYLVLNPTWTVPPGIIRNDILPDARRDPESITRRGLDVLDASGNKVDPASIDWSKFKSGNIPYTLRQDPGPKNALGPRQDHVSELVLRLSARHAVAVEVRRDRSRLQFRLRARRTSARARGVAAGRSCDLERRQDRAGSRRGPHAERDAAQQGAGAARLLDRVGGSAGTSELPPRCLRTGRAVGRRTRAAIYSAAQLPN